MALLNHRPSRRLMILLPVVLVGLGSGWYLTRGSGVDRAGLPTGSVSYQQVSAHPEAHLYYPGSRVFWRFGGPERRYLTLDGAEHDPAFTGAILTSDTTPEQIYWWYQLWLLKHGWHSHAYVMLDNWKSDEGYARGTRENSSWPWITPILSMTLWASASRPPAPSTKYAIASCPPARPNHDVASRDRRQRVGRAQNGWSVLADRGRTRDRSVLVPNDVSRCPCPARCGAVWPDRAARPAPIRRRSTARPPL